MWQSDGGVDAAGEQTAPPGGLGGQEVKGPSRSALERGQTG